MQLLSLCNWPSSWLHSLHNTPPWATFLVLWSSGNISQNMHSKAPVASQHEKTNKVVWICRDDWPPWRTSTYERPFTKEGNYLVLIVISVSYCCYSLGLSCVIWKDLIFNEVFRFRYTPHFRWTEQLGQLFRWSAHWDQNLEWVDIFRWSVQIQITPHFRWTEKLGQLFRSSAHLDQNLQWVDIFRWSLQIQIYPLAYRHLMAKNGNFRFLLLQLI